MLKYEFQGFIIVDPMFNVLKINGVILELFSAFLDLKEKENIAKCFKSTGLWWIKKIIDNVELAVECRDTKSFEFKPDNMPYDCNYKVDVMPVFGSEHICTIIKIDKANDINDTQENLINLEKLINLGKNGRWNSA